MINPNYDPYEDLENCKSAIQELGRAVEMLVKSNDLQANQIQRHEKRISSLNNRVENLKTRLNEAE